MPETPTIGQYSLQGMSKDNNAYLDASQNAGFTAYTHPNPSTGSPTIELYLEDESDVQIIVTSANGSKIHAINIGSLTAGIHSIPLNLELVPEGIYFCKVLAGKFPQTFKIIVTK
ncbi:MAG: T9SS type A sorting domain-containing protein [Bacteroidetes bacterium]|nr:T9SS type A sorting domain-containing protein [Bacteroidota bacterium]